MFLKYLGQHLFLLLLNLLRSLSLENEVELRYFCPFIIICPSNGKPHLLIIQVQTLMMKISPLHNIPCHLIFWLLVLNCPIKDHKAHVASTDLYTCTCISLNGKRKSYKQTSKISYKYLLWYRLLSGGSREWIAHFEVLNLIL